MSFHSVPTAGHEAAADGTILRDASRPVARYAPLKAFGHFRDLLADKEETSHVFKIFESLPSKSFLDRVRRLTLSPMGDRLRIEEPDLVLLLDDHDTIRQTRSGSVGHAYCDFMEREGLSAAGLRAEAEKLGNPRYDDLVAWFAARSRDTHDLMHVLTGYGRDALGEQCVLLFTHGQQPSHGHLLIGYLGALNIKQTVRTRAPILRAVRQAHRTGRACPPLVAMSIRELLAMDLQEARQALSIPEPTRYRECHAVWQREGINPYDLLANTAAISAEMPAT